MTGCLTAVFIGLLIALYVWIRRPQRRWNIDANIRKILSSNPGSEVVLIGLSDDVISEYVYQLKGYRGVRVSIQGRLTILQRY